MPRVLIIAYYWPPAGGGGVQRWLKFVRYLPEFGWEPVVYVPANAQYPLEDHSLLNEVPEGVEVIRGPIREVRGLYQKLKSLGGKKQVSDAGEMDTLFFRNPDELTWFAKLSLFIRSNLFIPDARRLWIAPSVRRLKQYLRSHPVDVIVSTGPPHSCHLIALRLKELTGIPWIADFRDPWMDIDYFPLLHLTTHARKRHAALQHAVLTQADRVVTVSWSWAELFQSYGATNVEVITNGFDPADIPEAEASAPGDQVIRIAAVGTLERDRAPRSVWQALNTLVQDMPEAKKRVEVHLAGKVDPDALPAEDVVRGMVRLHGYVPHGEAIAIMQKADVLLLLLNQNSTANTRGRIPGKLYEYLALRKPVLMLGDAGSDAGKLVNGLGNSWCVGYDDHAAMRDILEKILAGGTTSPGITTVDLNVYERRTLTGKLASVMNTLLSHK